MDTAFPAIFKQAVIQAAPLAIAFSGGLDSRFLAHAALCLAPQDARPHLYHIAGPHVPQLESQQAADWAASRGLSFSLVRVDPLEQSAVRAGAADRCYHCKRALFSALLTAVERECPFGNRTPRLCDGTNADDLGGYRPGLAALKELNIYSPLAEANVTKADIRRLAASTGMDRPDQQARPCLLTRFAYGVKPNATALAALDNAEQALAKQLPDIDFRLRLVAEKETLTGKLPFEAELHLSRPVEAMQEQELLKTVRTAGFAPPRLVVLQAVSGHYDRRMK